MIIRDNRKFNFTIIENDIIDNEEKYSKNELLAYIVLARYANQKDNTCYPSYSTIAKKMRCSKRSAIDAIDSLIKKGVIKKELRKTNKNKENKTNIYTIVGIDENGVCEDIKTKQIEKMKRNNQIKELNKNENVLLFKEIAPHIKLGRIQKIQIIDLDYSYLVKALDKAMLYGAKTFNYVMETYKSIYDEDLIRKNENLKENEKNGLTFYDKDEFLTTDSHIRAYTNYLEYGFENLIDDDKKLVIELANNGRIELVK